MNRNLKPTKSSYQIKEEQINFLEEYKKATELKDKQLAEAKKVLQGAKIATIYW